MNTLTINKAMTKEEVLKKVCCYHQEDKLEYTDDITIGEAMDAMTIWSNQQTAEKDKRIRELERELKELNNAYEGLDI